MRIGRTEADEQKAVIQWCILMEKRWPELEYLYHVPNGGSRNRIEAANLKEEGVKAGVPDLELPEQQPIGRWGRLHLRHLESNHPGHFQRFLFTGELDAYLHTVDEQASERFDVLMKGYAQSWGITEALKAEDPIKWVGLMNLARAEAEHNVMTEIICA